MARVYGEKVYVKPRGSKGRWPQRLHWVYKVMDGDKTLGTYMFESDAKRECEKFTTKST